jgi:enoyl-CoA hydratase/carnithine racemase
MTDELIALEITPPLALVTLNRPSALNALSPQLLDALADALEALDRDPELRVIILTGAG